MSPATRSANIPRLPQPAAFSIGDTARLLRMRGDAMQKAVPEGVGAMAALLGLDLAAAEAVAREAATADEVCEVANDNAPGQVVVSGHKAAVERAIEIAKGKGARRAMMLAVSAPFHCALMEPAAEVMANALAGTKIHPPAVPLVANVLAGPLSDPTEIRQRLVEQVTGTVRWRESMIWLGANGVTRFVEIGAGKVLIGLARAHRAGRKGGFAVGTPDDVRALAAETSRNREASLFSLAGKRALVTGASGGIGGAIASALHGQGATVTLSGTRRDALQELAGRFGERVHIAAADLADATSVEALVPEAERLMGGLDILVNNAGLTRDGLAVRMKDEDWQLVLRVNLEAAFRLSRAALKGMMRQRFGRIVGITSVVGRHRQCRPGELRRLEGRHDRHVQGAGAGGREPRHHRELRGARLHPERHDRPAEREAARGDPRHHPRAPARAATRSPPPSSIWRARRPPMSPGRRSM